MTTHPYPLWGIGNWCNMQIPSAYHYLDKVRAVLGDDFDPEGSQTERTANLLPEPTNPHDRYAVAVRIGDTKLGYLPKEEAIRYVQALNTIISAGYRPETPAEIWAAEGTRWDEELEREVPRFRAYLRIQLAEPHLITPLNDPPTVPYALLPDGHSVKVTKTEAHFDTLRDYNTPEGERNIIVTLAEITGGTVNFPKPIVQVNLDGKRIGQLTPQMSQSYLPALAHFARQGRLCAARAFLRSSSLAATVNLTAAKAHDLSDSFLAGPAVNLPALRAPLRTTTVLPSTRPRPARRTEVRGTTREGSQVRQIVSGDGLFVMEVAFASPLTPWQRKELTKVAGTAWQRAAESGAEVVPVDVTEASCSLSVLAGDVSKVLKAIEGIEASDFSLAHGFVRGV